MTELEQYKKAYATLLAHVDTTASKLMEKAKKTYPQGDNSLLLIALELIFILHDVEKIFLNEDPKDE